MAGRCSICISEKRAAIETAMKKGMSLRSIATKFNYCRTSVTKHFHEHMQTELVPQAEIKDYNLFSKVDALLENLQTITETGSVYMSIQAMKEMRQNIALLADLSIKLEKIRSTDVEHSREWIALRTKILKVLDEYPKARAALTKVLGAENVIRV